MNRYENNWLPVQPKREISISNNDVIHTLKMGERLDNISEKYYGDKLLSFIIMWANPQYSNEFEIPIGSKVRIPLPLSRITSIWQFEKK